MPSIESLALSAALAFPKIDSPVSGDTHVAFMEMTLLTSSLPVLLSFSVSMTFSPAQNGPAGAVRVSL